MLVEVVQRWKERRGVYRPSGETIVPREWEVSRVETGAARGFVVSHHYSGSFPAARRCFGLFDKRGTLSGVAVFSEPAQPRSLDVIPGDRETKTELGRLVLLDAVPSNGESMFLAQCFRDLRRNDGWEGAVSFSDPVPRTTADGRKVFRGHIGNVYQACNAIYLGRSASRVARLLPDGTVLHPRAMAKIRARDQGWRYSAGILERFGAAPLDENEDAAAWLRCWSDRLTRPLRHAGNLKYVIPFHSRLRRHLPAGLTYPKFVIEETAP
jgi:hypothetical protein